MFCPSAAFISATYYRLPLDLAGILERQQLPRCSVQAWDLARRLRVPAQLVPRTAALRDGRQAAVSWECYQNALHTAQAGRLAAEARAQAAISYVRPGPSFIERAQREAAVRDPFAAAWGADPLNRQMR